MEGISLTPRQQTSIKQMSHTNRPLNVNYGIDSSEIDPADDKTGKISDMNKTTDCDNPNESAADDSNIVKCIFLCKFHATAGPQIAAQVPKNFISKDVFDTVSRYIIPKAKLQRSFLSV